MTRLLEPARPEEVGLSSDGLDRIDAALQDLIDRGVLAGAVTLTARHGRTARVSTLGLKDIAAGEPLRPDTLFRAFSMTKPVTGTAMMILYDEGRWRPEDPIARHLPEFEGVQVFAGLGDDGKPQLEAAGHAPTMRELMTHTAGFAYGIQGGGDVDGLYRDADVWRAESLAEMSRRVAGCPLAYQPGSRWHYSLSMDLQGAVIERLTGQSLPDFMQERLFGPLGMTDTAFYTPPDKVSRRATLYLGGPGGGLTPTPNPLMRDMEHTPAAASGGGGLISTALDYARYGQLLLNGGIWGGRRIVSADALKLQMSNHLADTILEQGFFVGHQRIRPGFGYGFNGVVFTDPVQAGIPVGTGTYHWDGAAGTWFWVDPENDLLFVGMIQLLSANAPPVQAMTQTLMADAIVR